MRIEILHVPGCPGLAAAQAEVQRWLAAQQQSAEITEVPISSEVEAQKWHFRGSPTIRIDGRDVGGSKIESGGGIYCRLGAPEVTDGGT